MQLNSVPQSSLLQASSLLWNPPATFCLIYPASYTCNHDPRLSLLLDTDNHFAVLLFRFCTGSVIDGARSRPSGDLNPSLWLWAQFPLLCPLYTSHSAPRFPSRDPTAPQSMAIRSGSSGVEGHNEAHAPAERKIGHLKNHKEGSWPLCTFQPSGFHSGKMFSCGERELCAVLGAHGSEEDGTIFLRGSAAQACLEPKALDTHLNTLPAPHTPTHLSPDSQCFV